MTDLSGAISGLHCLASSFEERKLLRIARMFERATDWHTRRPELAFIVEKPLMPRPALSDSTPRTDLLPQQSGGFE